MTAEKWLASPRHRGAYAVVRVEVRSEATPVEQRVTVKKIVATLDRARSEVERLNALQAGKSCYYFWQYTRIDNEDMEHLATATCEETDTGTSKLPG